ncbi:MAG: cytochrome c [Saprospiraceae bacterium]|nr:cytochrome c [Saprospiraceae bacterium]
MILKPALAFSLLSVAFLTFSLSIYLKPGFVAAALGVEKDKASAGRLVWQKYNCQSCHQLYGLGGYLGPDLTNVYSMPGKGENLIRALLITGVVQMPAFQMSEKETDHLIEFLKQTDASGSADPRGFSILSSGMTIRK